MANTVVFHGTDRQSNSGTATLLNGATTAVVNHGLTATPTIVLVTPRTVGNAATVRVSARTTTTFTITVNADPGADITLDWFAAVNPATGNGFG